MVTTETLPEKKKDWVTPVAVVGGGALLVGGLYYFLQKKEGFSNLSIDSYKNITTGVERESPAVLTIDDGDLVQVKFSYYYKGPGASGKYHGAFWQASGIDPHDELSPVEVEFTQPESSSSKKFSGSVLLTNETMQVGTYGLYVKIMGISGGDLHFYLANAVKVVSGVVSLGVVNTNKYSYQPGESVTITVPVTNNTESPVAGNVKVTIMQGALIGSGSVLNVQNKNVTVPANSTQNAVFTYTAQDVGGDATRDVDVDLTVGGSQVDHTEDDDVFRVEGGAGAAVLNAGWSGGVLSYSFSGFPPNVWITLTIEQTGGSVVKSSDPNGAGSGSFLDNDPAGTYTLRATDAYGHVATASFTISVDYDLSIGEPTVPRYQYYDGQQVDITIPITNHGSSTVVAALKTTIMQGALIGSGQILDERSGYIQVPANATANMLFTHWATYLPGDATRDIDLDLTVGGSQVSHLERDNLFRVG